MVRPHNHLLGFFTTVDIGGRDYGGHAFAALLELNDLGNVVGYFPIDYAGGASLDQPLTAERDSQKYHIVDTGVLAPISAEAAHAIMQRMQNLEADLDRGIRHYRFRPWTKAAPGSAETDCIRFSIDTCREYGGFDVEAYVPFARSAESFSWYRDELKNRIDMGGTLQGECVTRPLKLTDGSELFAFAANHRPVNLLDTLNYLQFSPSQRAIDHLRHDARPMPAPAPRPQVGERPLHEPITTASKSAGASRSDG